MAARLTFTINPEAQSTSFDLFLKAARDINRLLIDIDYAIHRDKVARRWIIYSIHSSAPTITLESLRGDEETAVAIADGIRAITVGIDTPPGHFTEDALLDLKRMRTLFVGRDRAVSIVVSQDSKPAATIKEDISGKADRILTGGYWNLGSIEGDLEEVNLHKTLSFMIWDRVSRAPVKCFVSKTPSLTAKVKSLLERRVFVQGRIRYFTNGIPRSVSEIMDIVDATHEVNTPMATFGSIPDARAARDPVGFIRSIWGELVENG